jgi:hypothetical protein
MSEQQSHISDKNGGTRACDKQLRPRLSNEHSEYRDRRKEEVEEEIGGPRKPAVEGDAF